MRWSKGIEPMRKRTVAHANLIQAGWAGERMSEASAANRLRVAIATLRKLGLRDVIVSRQGGYRLHPSCQLAELQPAR